MSDLELAKIAALAIWPDLTWDYIEKHSDTTMFREIADAILSSDWIEQVKQEAAAFAVERAADAVERLYAGSDTDTWGRGYIAGCDRSARVLRDRADAIRSEATS